MNRLNTRIIGMEGKEDNQDNGTLNIFNKSRKDSFFNERKEVIILVQNHREQQIDWNRKVSAL